MTKIERDLRYGARSLARSPGFAATAMITLALGIGATTAVFTLIQAVLLRPLPGREPGRLVNVHAVGADGTSFHGFSYPNFADLRRGTRRLEGLAAFTGRFVSLRQEKGSVPIAAQVVSANYFDVLGVAPAQGRAFGLNDEKGAGSSPVAIVSERLWRRQFSGASDLVGRSIVVNGHSFTVVGILPKGFAGTFAGFKFDLWFPMSTTAEVAPGQNLQDRGDPWLELIGRLAGDASIPDAVAELSVLAKGLALDFPRENRGMGVDVRPATPLDDSLRRAVTMLFALLAGVSGLVLLIASVNLSSLMLARNLARSREFAIRRAIGAGRGDLLRQAFVETLLLFSGGGAGGFLLAFWLCRLLTSFTPRFAVPLELDLTPDLKSLAFAAAATLGAALTFGLAPALTRTRLDLSSALREGSGATRPLRSRRIFVTAQLAISTVLLVGAGLLLRSIDAIGRTDPGFDAAGVRMGTLNLALVSKDEGSGRLFYRRLMSRLETLPGVSSVSLAQRIPLGGFGRSSEPIRLPGRNSQDAEGPTAYTNTVSPGFFRTLKIPILSGRGFTDSDDANSAGVVVVNETLANRFWPRQDPLGKTLLVGGADVRVIGIAKNGKYRSLAEPPQPAVFFPFAQRFSARMTVLLKADGAAEAPLSAAFRREVAALSPDLPVLDTMAVTDYIGVSFLPQRMAGAVTTALGLLGLLLASIGLYGLFAYEVGQRRREIGVRVALGARPAAIAALVFRHGALLIAGGAGVGLLVALATTRVLQGLLFGVAPDDPLVFAAVPLFLVGVALAATSLPARAAARLDPMIALRSE